MASRSKFYTGIGSRQTPPDVLSKMISIAAHLRVEHWKLRSGGADGADKAFETGAAPHMHIYLPWKGFNGAPDEPPYQWKYEKKYQAELIAKDIHPVWHILSPGERKLHTRNIFQVLGPSLDEPSRFLFCWTKEGKTRGGTRTALVLAERNNIPVFNLYDYAFSGMDAETLVAAAIKADLVLHPAT